MSNNKTEGKSSAIVSNNSSLCSQQMNMNPSSSTAGESTKKRNRIDFFAAALARSRTNTASRMDFNLSTIISKEMPPNCHICGLDVNNLEEKRKCSICNRIVHTNCNDEELGGTFGLYNCLTCRNSPLIGSDSKLYQMQQSTEVGSISDEEFGYQLGQKYYRNYNEANSTSKLGGGEHSTRDNLNEFYSGFSTPFDDPSPTTASNSIHGSATPTPQPEGTGSDNDEYQPPGAIRKSETTRGNRGKGKGKKPATASMESGRQTTMKTRSGGKLPTTSYAAKLATAYSVETGDERIGGGQRVRGKGSKGKGSYRGRRNTGRGGKLVSMFTSGAMVGNSRRESGLRENSQDIGGAGKRLSLEKNDYIRTAVVTSINDKFIVECPNLCLICGSIGKDSEGTMISCMACAQYFHTYCVSMHDKLNMTLIKRGWRCLDCTVCEGCGSGEDESNLILCDECDISYHIYCLDPPLGCIPPGSWRCKWCSTCIRCNVQVKAGIDLQRTEGYCQTCYSLRKCPKCSQFYGIGDLVLKCQHCLRWFHGRCEGHLNEEQVENAAENAFRCSLCRPQTFNDISNMPIIVDNVMVSKSMVEQIHGIRRFPFFGEHLANISRSFSNDHDEAEMDDEQQLISASLYSMRGRGGSTTRGGGPGRRVMKLGVGGFIVRNPKSRLLATIGGQSGNLSLEDDIGQSHGGTEEDGKQPKIRRPRKLRKPLLEDAYPPNIQESFFGVPAVESRGLADQSVDEPTLSEYKKSSTNLESTKFLSELSEHSAELLRNEQEMDMLGDIPLVDDIGLDMDIENLDFTDLIVGGEDEEEAMMAADNVDSLDGFNAGSTSSLIQNNAADLCSSSASSNRVPSRTNDPMSHSAAIQNILATHGRQANEQAKPIEQHRLSAAAQAAERWEEDEPLGDKATKAAVLYANVLHPNMKEKFPLWTDRVRQINKVWRELSSEKRQQFVEMARKNRLNCPAPRKRGKRITSLENPTAGQQQPQKANEFAAKNPQTLVETFNQQQNASISSNKIASSDSVTDEKPITDITFMQSSNAHQPLTDQNACQMNQSTDFQKRTLELKLQLQMEEDKIAQMKKEKRALAAKQRQLVKQIETIPSDQKKQKEMELKNVEENLTLAKKSVQTQQRIVDKCRQRLKEHQGPQQQSQQTPSNLQRQQFSILQQQPTTSSQIINQPFNPAGNELFFRQGTSFEINSEQNLLPLPFGIKQQPADSQFSSALPLNTTTKGTRGRKRKKMRTPMLGGISFSSLQSTEEMEIYDLVDGMLNIIETNNDGKMAEALFVKRILLSQQQQEQMTSQPLGAMDPLKTKKKRQIAQKGRITSDMNTEVEMLQERVKDSLSMLPTLTYSLEQFQSSDKQMLKYPNQTGLPDHPGSDAPLREQEIGKFCLPFMSDFYDDLEIPDDDYIDEESLFPPTMDEICGDVDLDELELDTNDAPEEEKYVDFGMKGKSTTELLDLDLPFLSIDNIADRVQLEKSTLLLGNNGPEVDVPIDPHFSRFEAKPKDFDRQVDIIVDIDPSVLPREELLTHLRQLLGDPNMTAMEIVTPPQTPASPNKQSTIQNIIKSAENFKQNSQQETSTLVCKKCGNSLLSEQQAIEEYPTRIGLTDEKEQKVKFCSMSCYFNFLAQYVPLDVELLEMAESYVDEATLERLRQISAENFAKRINTGFPTQSNNFEQIHQMDHLIASIMPSTNQPSLSSLENANFPREVQIRSTELSTILQNNKNADERKKLGNEFKWRGHGWIKYDFELIQSFQRHQEELKQKFALMSMKIFNKMDATEDTRFCAFCGEVGDGEQDQCGRLLNVDANEWVHVNCALWSAEVHISEEGALMNVDCALRRAKRVECKICRQPGASIRCYKLDCANKDMAFHLLCARSNGFFIKDKTYFCANHEIRPDAIIRLDAIRRLYIHRDENQLLSKIFNHSSPTEMIMRVGSLIFQKIGQLLPDQLRVFTTPDHIFPVGFKITRFFWSVSNTHQNEWMRFECKIADNNGSPEFLVRNVETQKEYRGANPTAAWFDIQHKISEMREKTQLLRFFPSLISGETLFGLTEPSISKMLESLPGVDQLFTYTFKHGGTPLMDVPLAENPSGCARCEPCFRTLVKRKHRPIISNSPKKGDEKAAYNSSETIMTREGRVRSVSSRFIASTSITKIDQEMLKAYKASGISERMLQAPYLRNNEAAQLLIQYKEMKKEWKENVYLARSKIQGLGLYAKRDIDMNQFIIEYIGEMIRNEVCEIRQKKYTEQNRGEYMFRIDVDWVVDATMSGGLARYINHSCDPNCGTKILTMNDEKKIVIYANRPIKAGEEIPCLCGAPNCARWMN